MTLAYWRDAKSRVVREWHCCGQVWQLLATAQFPERQQWHPACQRCGAAATALRRWRRSSSRKVAPI